MDGTVANQVCWLLANPICSSLPQPAGRFGASGKRLPDVKGHLIPQDVVARTGQFMGYGLDGHHPIRFGLLALVKPFNPGIVADRKIGGLHKGPG